MSLLNNPMLRTALISLAVVWAANNVDFVKKIVNNSWS